MGNHRMMSTKKPQFLRIRKCGESEYVCLHMECMHMYYSPQSGIKCYMDVTCNCELSLV